MYQRNKAMRTKDKLNLIVTTFPDSSTKIELKKPFDKFSQCLDILKEYGFTRDIEFGNIWRFLGPVATAFIIKNESTGYTGIYFITVYPNAGK